MSKYIRVRFLCVFKRVHVDACVFVHSGVFLEFLHVCVGMRVCACSYVFVCMYIHVCSCTSVRVCACVRVSACVRLCRTDR